MEQPLALKARIIQCWWRRRRNKKVSNVALPGSSSAPHKQLLCILRIQRWIRRRRDHLRMSRAAVVMQRFARKALRRTQRSSIAAAAAAAAAAALNISAAPPRQSHTYRSGCKHKQTLRMLLVFANPFHTLPLRLQAEERAIRESIRHQQSTHIELDVLPAATLDDLGRLVTSA
jgi:hypothetical protein